MASIDEIEVTPEVQTPLHVLRSCEMSAETTDIEFLLQVEAGRCHEESRWAQAQETTSSGANDVIFPMPNELLLWSPARPFISMPLQPLYDKLGTWEVLAEQASEAIRLHTAVPFDFGVAPERKVSDDCLVDVGIQTLELYHWSEILAEKQHERSVWGCFDSALFPEFKTGHFVDGISASTARDSIAVSTGTFVRLSLDPSVLRSDVHANESVLITSIDETGSAWDMMPESVVNAVPEDIFNALVSGEFCFRDAEEPQLEPIVPHEDWLCCICLDDGCDGAILASCGHTFHKYCIERWFRKSSRCPLCRYKCRLGPPTRGPPMVFDLEPWPMLPAAVIEQDVATSVQEHIAAKRAQKPLSAARIDARRKQLANRFKCQVPNSSFFLESLVEDDGTIGPAAVVARSARDRKEAALIHDQLDLEGRSLTSWPTGGRWPALAMSPCNVAALARLEKRLEQSRLKVQCRTPRGLARYLLKQHYRNTLRDQSSPGIAGLRSMPAECIAVRDVATVKKGLQISTMEAIQLQVGEDDRLFLQQMGANGTEVN